LFTLDIAPWGIPMTIAAKTITDWIVDLKLGDSQAADELWKRFFAKLCGRLRQKIGPQNRSVDEEDLAISAIHALYAGAREGRFARLDSRDDLWQLLVLIGSRKAVSSQRAAKARGHLGESAVEVGNDVAMGLGQVMACEVDDKLIDGLDLTCREMLSGLEPPFRELALLKLEGFTNKEITIKLGRSERTVERHLMIIREAWKRLG